MAKLLDDLSKNLAGGMTRRRALTAFGASVAGAMAFWSKPAEAQTVGCFNFSSDPCVNFCADLYGGLGTVGGPTGTTVYEECLNRCQPVTDIEAERTICPPNTAAIRIGQHFPTRTINPDPEYNPFPQVLTHPYIVCAPFFVNNIQINGLGLSAPRRPR